jgi:hypothetical protein
MKKIKISLYAIMAVFVVETAKAANDNLNQRLAESSFSSYHEFGLRACLPCHYGDNGTNLVKSFDMMTETDLKNYLNIMLNSGNMPPDEVFRGILLKKFKKLNFSHLSAPSNSN